MHHTASAELVNEKFIHINDVSGGFLFFLSSCVPVFG